MKRILIIWLVHFIITIGCIIIMSGLVHKNLMGDQTVSYLILTLKFFAELLSNPIQPFIKMWASPKSLEFIPFLIINSLIWAVVVKYLHDKWRYFRKST